MFVKRRIVLSSTAVLAETILRHEDLADTLLASQVLERARDEAEQWRTLFEEHARREHEQAVAGFWESANDFLQSLAQQHQALQQQSMQAVEELLYTALAQLLDEASLAERARALVRNLAQSQPHVVVATLSAHPDQLEPLSEWLGNSRFAENWQLKSDTTLGPDTLRLSDANGAFDIDWPALRRGLLSTDGFN